MSPCVRICHNNGIDLHSVSAIFIYTTMPDWAEFLTCVAENSAHASSVILDCILSLSITRSVLQSIYSLTF